MKDWRTTLWGIAAAIATALPDVINAVSGKHYDAWHFALAVALVLLGRSSKDGPGAVPPK